MFLQLTTEQKATWTLRTFPVPLALSAGIMLTMYGVSLGVLGPLLGRISDAYGLGLAGKSLLTSVQLAGYLTAIVGSGPLSDRFGRRGTVLVGLCAFVAGAAFFGGSRTLVGGIIALVAFGLGAGMINVGSSGLFSDLFSSRSGFALNFSRIFPSIGTILVPSMVWICDRYDWSWRSIYTALATAGIATSLLVWRSNFPPTNQGRRFEWRKAREMLVNRPVLLLWMTGVFYIGAEMGYWTWLGTYVERVRGFSDDRANLLFGAFTVAMLLGRVSSPWIARRLGDSRIVYLSGVVSVFGMIATAIIGRPDLMLASIVVTGLVLAPLFPALISLGSGRYPGLTGTVVSILFTSLAVGGMALPGMVGIVGETIGLQRSFMVIPAATMTVMLLLHLLTNVSHRFAGEPALEDSAAPGTKVSS